MDPDIGQDCLMVATTTREIREVGSRACSVLTAQTIGSTLELVAKLTRSASYTSNTSASSALLEVVRSEEARLAVYRNVAIETVSEMHDLFDNCSSPHSSPTKLAITSGSMLSYGAHSLGVENAVDLDAGDSEDIPGKADNAFQTDGEEGDTFGIRETTLSLPGEDLDAIVDNLRMDPSATDGISDEQAVIDRYKGYLKDDLATLSNGTIGHQWWRLAQAISIQIREAPKDDVRDSGRDRLWYRPGLGKKQKKEMVAQGGCELREIRRFNKESAADNAFAIGVGCSTFAHGCCLQTDLVPYVTKYYSIWSRQQVY
jgi:hypothetical protein